MARTGVDAQQRVDQWLGRVLGAVGICCTHLAIIGSTGHELFLWDGLCEVRSKVRCERRRQGSMQEARSGPENAEWQQPGRSADPALLDHLHRLCSPSASGPMT